MSPIKDHLKSTFLMAMEFVILKKVKFTSEILLMGKQKQKMVSSFILMALIMKGASKIQTSMDMVCFIMEIRQ